MRRRVLLVEFKYHQEIIPAQLLMLLRANCDVHVFLDESLWDEQLLGPFKGQVTFTLLSHTKKIGAKISALFRIRRYIKENEITHLVVNTLDSNFNYYVLRFNPAVHAVGIVHQVHRFVRKRSHRKSLAKVKGVATLSDYTLAYFKEHLHIDGKAAYFYPIYFKTDSSPLPSNADISVVIPGQLDLNKRDYFQLIEALERSDKSLSIKFHLLGNKNRNNGPEIVEAIKSKGLSEYFFLSDGFLPYDEFFKIIRASDYVMPLLSRAIPNYKHYLESQISASFNWGYAFQKKLLLHEDFAKVVQGNDAEFYSDERLPDVLHQLTKASPAGRASRHLDFEVQQDNYLRLFVD